MFAAFSGNSRVVRVLLNKGANVLIVDGDGSAALHMAAGEEHLAGTTLLVVKAGADLEAKSFTGGITPLHLAAGRGHSEVMGVLIEEGANPISRALSGMTPLHNAASEVHADAIKVLLLRAKAGPLLATISYPSRMTLIPLDIAATEGRMNAVRELIQEHGIKGCGGPSGGVHALRQAAANQHAAVLAALTDTYGVVDTGTALAYAVSFGHEASVKFLLRQQEGKTSGGGAYVNSHQDVYNPTPLFMLWAFPMLCLLGLFGYWWMLERTRP